MSKIVTCVSFISMGYNYASGWGGLLTSKSKV